jgi:hypothetical protein
VHSQNNSEIPALCEERLITPKAVKINLGVQRARFLPRPYDTIWAKHLSHLDQETFLLGGVVEYSEALALVEAAQPRRVGGRDHRPKMEPSMKTTRPASRLAKRSKDAGCAEAHKVEDCPLDAQIREGFVQDLEDSIAAPEIGFVHESAHCSIGYG